MHSVFVSDLHLCPTRPAINKIFFDFLHGPAVQADSLYILGDLFEYWAGDDDDDPFNVSVLSALHELAGRGVSLYLMHGNRDFLIGGRFTAACHARLLPDPTLVNLYGTPTLLMHGDTLCTDDVKYQKFRAEVRDMEWQRKFLAQPLASRKQVIAGLRADSTKEKKLKTEAIMDVTVTAVEAELRNHGYPRLIHGHTHRPALHQHSVDGRSCARWVLADWYTSGSYLYCDAAGCRVIELDTQRTGGYV
jgi:UDP-2,3-diacylglucosamine hydrolase